MPDQLLQPPLAQAPLPATLSPLTPAGRPRTVHNPTIGDYATFLRSTEETGGECVLIRVQLPARGGARLARHIHLKSRETFVVTEGELTIEKGSDVAVLKVGESAVVEPGEHHRYLSTSDLPCVFEVELRPAGKNEDGLRVIYGLAKDGKCGPDSVPRNPLELALAAQYSDIYLTTVPVWVQQAVFGVLGSIARMLGTDRGFARYLEAEPAVQ